MIPTTRYAATTRRTLFMLLVALGVAACADTSTAPAGLSAIDVALASTSVQAGRSTSASAQGRASDGSATATGKIVWSSSASTVATINEFGVITAVAAGTTQITATSGSISGTQALTVTPPPPALTTIVVALPSASLALGESSLATATGRDQFGAAFPTGTVTWTSATTTVATVSTAGVVTAVAPGTTQLTAAAGGRTGTLTVTVNAPPGIRINEVESSGGTPGDWVELFNATNTTVDLSGWALKDNDDSRTFRFATGTTIAAGAHLVVEEATFNYGLGAADSVRLSNQFGARVDSYGWTAHASTTYGRCPNGSGPFVTMSSVTKGAANDCRPQIKVNEVESNGGTPGDWIELYNVGTTTVDLSGFIVKDNDDARTTRLPAGSMIAPGAFFVIEETTLGFGLGSADAARIFDATGVLIDEYAWTSHATTTYARCPDGTGGFSTSTTSTKGAANNCVGSVKVNEVESNGGTPGDWIELYNAGGSPVDISNYLVKDNDDTRTTRIPAGTTLAPGAFYVIEETALGFGLGGADAARLFDANGALVDSYEWTVHAAITYGRCPDGFGAFASTTVSTKGAANICTPVVAPSAPWPGSDNTQAVVGANVFGTNMSGLTFESATGGNPSVLWASKNGPGSLYRLIFSGGLWTPDPANNWATGKLLRYLDGTGDVDAEGVTFAAGGSAGGMYISAERNNAVSGVSRNSVLRYDVSQPGTSLTPTHEWNLTSDLPVVGANLGAEAITWIPDSVLVNRAFFDESKNRAYNPADYADHGTGIFFVGLEANGVIYAFALNHANSSFTRVATITTGYPGVMGLEYDPTTKYLWAICDDGCGTTMGVLEIDVATGSPTRGRFQAPRRFARPASLGNFNNEGFAFGTQAECVNGLKPAFWADDNQTGGFAIRSASMPCGTIAAAPFMARARR